MGRRIGDVVGRRFLAVDPAELAASYQAAIADAAAIVTVGQDGAATLARAYMLTMSRLELGEGQLAPALEDNAGQTADHRSVAEGLAATPAKVFLALQKGKPLDQAIRFGQFSAARFGQSETLDAGRLEIGSQLEALGLGWRWRSRGTCGACMSMDDGRTRKGGRLNAHPSCECVQEPDFGGDLERPTGRDRFDQLSRAEQDAALGAETAELLRSGKLGWDELVKVERFKEWRPIIVQRPLEDLQTS